MPASAEQRERTAERRQKALALRLAGADWEAIARTLGYSGKAAACKDVTRALAESAEARPRQAEVLREEMLLTLDRLQRAQWQAAINGDPRACEAVLKIADRRARLLKLDTLPGAADLDLQFEQQEALRRQGATLAEIVRRFATNAGLDAADPQTWTALRSAVRQVVGASAPQIIEGSAA